MASSNGPRNRAADIARMMAEMAAAKEEVLSKSVLDALMNARPEDLVGPDPAAEVLKGNANPSGAWVHGPALVELFAVTEKRLTRIANWAGLNVNQVTKVHARLLNGTKLLIIKAAAAEDLTATPVQRYSRAAYINLVSLLGEHGLTVQSGYRERFDVAYVPKESPLWPALVIDLGQVKERRQESSSKKDQSSQQDS